MANDPLDDWLETKFREYYPDTQSFFVGADDEDRLTLNADNHGMTWTQTTANMENSDDEFFVFESDETGRIMTIPFPPPELPTVRLVSDSPILGNFLDALMLETMYTMWAQAMTILLGGRLYPSFGRTLFFDRLSTLVLMKGN